MKHTKESIEGAVINSISIAGVLKKLGLKLTGGNYSHIKLLIRKFNINTSHFLGMAHNRGKACVNKHTKESFIKTHLIIKDRDKPVTTDRIKKWLLEFGMKDRVCERCMNVTWLGNDIPLELHHKNGDRWDNRLFNLEILCPNCHALENNN